MRRVVYGFIDLCGLILTVIAFCMAVNNEISLMPIMTIAIALLVVVGNLLFRYRQEIIRWACVHQKSIKIGIVAIASLAVMARFAPLIFNMEYVMADDLGDVATHYYGAVNPMSIIACWFSMNLVLINAFLMAKTVLRDDVLGSSGGWSFYVGSNYLSQGVWTAADRDLFWGEVIPGHDTIAEAHTDIKQRGVERYSELSLLQLVNHLARKIDVLFGDAGNSIYDIRYAFDIKQNSKLHKV